MMSTAETIGCGPSRDRKPDWADVQKQSEKAQQRVKKYYDRGTRVKILKVNGIVLKLKEVDLGLDQKYDGPYIIINVTASDTYQLELVNNPTKVTTAHANKLKNITTMIYVWRTFLR